MIVSEKVLLDQFMTFGITWIYQFFFVVFFCMCVCVGGGGHINVNVRLVSHSSVSVHLNRIIKICLDLKLCWLYFEVSFL